MKLNILLYCRFIFSLSILFLMYSTHASASTYSECNSILFSNIMNNLKLLSKETLTYSNSDQRSDCIQLNESHFLIVTANSIPTETYTYKINLYLINPKTKKVLLHYTHPQKISEENSAFSSIKFDHVAFSNISNQHVIGLKTHSFNNGVHSFDIDQLNLFRIQLNSVTSKTNTIQWVLKNLVIKVQSGWRPYYGCDSGDTENIKSILILQKSQNNNLQNILLKQNQYIENTNEKCKITHEQKQSQQLLKFNGQQYMLNQKKLLKSVDIAHVD